MYCPVNPTFYLVSPLVRQGYTGVNYFLIFAEAVLTCPRDQSFGQKDEKYLTFKMKKKKNNKIKRIDK